MKARTICLLTASLALLILAGAAIAYLRSERFQERMREVLIARIEEATGLKAGVGRFSLDLVRGRFLLNQFELRSPKGTGSSFSLAVDEISGTIRLAGLWRPKIDLGELNLIRPRMRIVPEPNAASPSLQPIIRRSLDIAARRATIKDGWVELNYRHIPLDLVMDALNCRIQYRGNPQSYVVELAYKNSPLDWADRKFVYDLNAHVQLLPSGLVIDSFELREDKSHLSGVGRVDDWEAPVLQVRASGTIAGENLTLLTPDLKEARGDVSVTSNIHWDALGYHLTGQFAAEAVHYRQTTASRVTGKFDIKDDVLRLRTVSGQMGGGSFRVDGDVQLKAASPAPHHIKISAKNVVVRDASGILGLRAPALENSVDAELAIDWRHGSEDLAIEGTVNLHALTQGVSESAMRTPLVGTADFAYRNEVWYVKRASLISPNTRVEELGLDPERWHIQLDTDRAAEVLPIARSFSASLEDLVEANPDLAAISGRYHLDGDILLRPAGAMAYEGQVVVTEGRWRKYGVDSLSANASWAGSNLRLRSMKLRKDVQSAEGDFAVDVPQGGAGAGFRYEGTLSRISLASLADMGIDLKAQVAGSLSGRGRVSYERGVLQGDAQLEVQNGSYNGLSLDLVRAVLAAKDQELHITEGEVMRGSAALSVHGQVNLNTREMNLSARLRELPLLDIPEVKASGVHLDGRVSVSGEIHGTPDMPEVKGSFDLQDLVYAGWNLGAGKATVDLHDKVLSTKFDVQSDLGGFQGEARFSTEPGYSGRATVEFRDWNVRKIIASNAPALFNDFSTALHGSLTIEGPFAELPKLKYRGEMDGARFKVHGYEFHNDGMMRFSGDNQKLVVEDARLVGQGSSLALEKNGVFPLEADGALNLHLVGRLNLGFLDHLVAKVGVSGSSTIDVNITGSQRAPEVLGRVTLEDARVNYEDLPYPLSALRGNIVFSRSSVKLENVTGAIASGTIQLSGSVEHQGGELRGINLQISMRKARLRYPADFVSTVDADLDLRGAPDAQVLTGDVNVVRADYLRDFTVLQQFLGHPSGPSGPQVIDPVLAGVRLNVSVHSQDGLYIDNELIRVQAGVSLTLRGTLAYPSLTGRVDALEGSIFFRGNRFDILDASADFVDRNRINPVLDVRAEADVQSYRLRLDVGGDLDHLRLNVSSDPPLSTVDILSLLTTGKSEDTATTGTETLRHQSEMTGLSAASILSEGLTGALGRRVERIFGLQSFRVDPFLAGVENDPTARVTISERLSKDLVVTFSRNLSTSKEQIVVIEYNVNKNLTIVATRDELGAYGIDFRFRRRLP
jgi:translocation and assembly module TamB